MCLITSRDTQRWIIPKGWVGKRIAPHEQALREARDEAGLTGEIEATPIGVYHYVKDGRQPCKVEVFPMFVTGQLESWKEHAERSRHWVLADAAAHLVEERELAELLDDLDDLLG